MTNSIRRSVLATLVALVGCNPNTIENNHTTERNHMYPQHQLEGHKGYVTGVTFITNTILASASFDKTIRLWDIDAGKELYSQECHSEPIYSLAGDHRTKKLVSGGWGKRVKVWKVDTTNYTFSSMSEKQLSHPVKALALASNGIVAIGTVGNTVGLWDMQNDATVEITSREQTGDVEDLAFSRDGIHLGVVDSNGIVALWNVSMRTYSTVSKEPKQEALRPREDVLCIALSPDKQLIAIGGLDTSISIMDASSGNMISVLRGHRQQVNKLCFSPSGKWLASGGGEGYRTPGEAIIWDVPSGSELSELEGHQRPVRCLSFSPEGTVLATGGEDGKILLWDLTRLTH